MSKTIIFTKLRFRVWLLYVYYRIGHWHLLQSKKHLEDNNEIEQWRYHSLKTLQYFDKCHKQEIKIEKLKKNTSKD